MKNIVYRGQACHCSPNHIPFVDNCAKYASARRRAGPSATAGSRLRRAPTRFLGKGSPNFSTPFRRNSLYSDAALGRGNPPGTPERRSARPFARAPAWSGRQRCAVICKQRSTPSKATDGISDQCGSGKGNHAWRRVAGARIHSTRGFRWPLRGCGAVRQRKRGLERNHL